MATAAESEANRRNARFSTGPRTDAGKATASRNATKLGLFSRHVLLPGEDEEAFGEFRDGLLARLKPIDALERVYAERIVAAGWRLQRALAGEAKLFEEWGRGEGRLQPPQVFTRQYPMQGVERLQKHIASLERAMDKALAELKKIQEARTEEDSEEPIRENEPNSAPTFASARIEIVKTNPIPASLEEVKQREETPNRHNEPNSIGESAGDAGGGAFPAPTPELT